MRNRFEVTLNGRALTGLNDQLYITDLHYESAGYKDTAATIAKRNGVLLQDRYYQSTSVIVEFELHVYDPLERHNALTDIVSWAMQGGVLKTSDRSGMFLRVICEEPPLMASAQGWTDKLSITFVAYNPPYWQNDTPDTLTLTDGTGTLYVHGNAGDVPADAEITAVSAVTDITLTANERHITLTGLAMAAGQKLVINHDENGFLQIMINGVSQMSKRTGADELYVACQATNTLGITANGDVSCVFSVRGRWY